MHREELPERYGIPYQRRGIVLLEWTIFAAVRRCLALRGKFASPAQGGSSQSRTSTVNDPGGRSANTPKGPGERPDWGNFGCSSCVPIRCR